MAKISAHGTELARCDNGTTRYRAMSDGVILRQFHIMGTWETPTISRRCVDGADAARRIGVQATKEGWK